MRWRTQFTKIHPDLGICIYLGSIYHCLLITSTFSLRSVEESENPPDTWTDRHLDTPLVLKLKADYIREHPQVWLSSITPPGSVRRDVEGEQLKLMDTRTWFNTVRPDEV